MKCVFLGCAKNCAVYLPLVYRYTIEPISELFDETHTIIYENDSTDKTLTELRKFATHIISEKNVKGSRTGILAHGRNMVMSKALELHPDADYFIVLDLDNVCATAINIAVFKDALDHADQWDAISFNRETYYDIWALRWEKYPENCWKKGLGHSYVNESQRAIISELKERDTYLPVQSAFGGFAIYKPNAVVGCVYSGDSNDGVDCEHVSFHKDMIEKNGARILISPHHLY